MLTEFLISIIVTAPLLVALGYWLRLELRKRIVTIMDQFERKLGSEVERTVAALSVKNELRGLDSQVQTGIKQLDSQVQTGIKRLDSQVQTGIKRLSSDLKSSSAEILKNLSSEIKSVSGNIRDLQMVVVAEKERTPSALEPINWARWIPLAQEERFVASFFDFGRLEKIKDTAERRLRTFTMSGVLDWLGRSGRLQSDVVECGCYRGHTSYVIASVLKAHRFEGKFHIFDSFEGLSDVVDQDLQPIANGPGSEELKKHYTPNAGGRLFLGDLERVKRNLSGFDFINYYKGWIPQRFHEVKHKEFSFVHLDVDLYEPTREGLEFFYPRVMEGGAIIVDDYGLNSWPGCTRATDEFLAKVRPTLVLNTPAGGLVIVK